MKQLKIIAFTHKTAGLNTVGKLHMDEARRAEVLGRLKSGSGADELMYLSTCNRVEFILSAAEAIDEQYLFRFFSLFRPEWDRQELAEIVSAVSVLESEDALRHLYRVASSLDSLVVGEREIITQVRNAYEWCRKENLTGDLLRLVIRKTIECAKEVYTKTNIARNPVSVMSLAYRRLRDLQIKMDARFLFIGAGIT